MIKHRRYNAWRSLVLGPRIRTSLQANCPVEEELFGTLHSVSEVREAGLDFIRDLGQDQPRRVFPLFQAFVRQARTFYESAATLHYRAKPLMYYYAFLNLAKAFISLSRPSVVSQAITHGLTLKHKVRPFNKQIVTVARQSGVFSQLYSLTFGQQIPPRTRLNVVNLMGYCTDISFEYQHAGFGSPKIVSGLSRLLVHQGESEAWACLALGSFERLRSYNKSLAAFNVQFEAVEPDRDLAFKVFGLSGEVYLQFAYFQDRSTHSYARDDDIPMADVASDALAAMVHMFESPLYEGDPDFMLAAPLRKNLQYPFNQYLAIYCVMFYLGSMVRYHPSYLERLLDSKDGWIIERFTKSAAGTFLRAMVNLIMRRDFVFSRR